MRLIRSTALAAVGLAAATANADTDQSDLGILLADWGCDINP